MATLVMKFGGSLAADARKISRVGQVVMAESLAWKRMVVIVSAMAVATDALNRAADLAAMRDAAGYRRIVAGLRSDHLAVINALFENEAQRRDLLGQMDRLLFGVLNTCDSVMARRDATARERDQVMAVGERMMVHILTALVRQVGLKMPLVDAALLII